MVMVVNVAHDFSVFILSVLLCNGIDFNRKKYTIPNTKVLMSKASGDDIRNGRQNRKLINDQACPGISIVQELFIGCRQSVKTFYHFAKVDLIISCNDIENMFR